MTDAQQLADRYPDHLVTPGQPDMTAFTAWWSIARRAFDIWRERRYTRAALANMTARELADIGMTPCDRTMALAGRGWVDPDRNRNITILSHRQPRIG